MKLSFKDTGGKTVGSMQVRDDVFDVPMNNALVHQVVVGQLSNSRHGTASTKSRGQVSGGGRKPRPQKGTGAARAGSTRSPIWVGGGVAFGPSPRSYRHRTPKKMRRASMLVVLSEKIRQSELVVLDRLGLNEPATREMVALLELLGAGPSILLVADGVESKVLRAANNIPRLKMIPSSLLNTLDLLNCSTVIMTVDSVRNAESLWARKFGSRKAHSAVSRS